MERNALHEVLIVDRPGGLPPASQLLDPAQKALEHMIQELQIDPDTALIERRTKGIFLKPPGAGQPAPRQQHAIESFERSPVV